MTREKRTQSLLTFKKVVHFLMLKSKKFRVESRSGSILMRSINNIHLTSLPWQHCKEERSEASSSHCAMPNEERPKATYFLIQTHVQCSKIRRCYSKDMSNPAQGGGPDQGNPDRGAQHQDLFFPLVLLSCMHQLPGRQN